jgi:ABC-type branched-subunit amino acid transport system substrate-binding protein
MSRLLLYCIWFLLSLNVCYAEARPRIGISLPLSGPLASMGQSFRRGFEMYQSEHPADTSDVDILFDDHRYDGKQSVTSFHQMTGAARVDYFVAWGNMPSETLAPIAESAKVPALFFTNASVAQNRKHVVAMGNRAAGTVQAISDFLLTSQARNPAALSLNVGNALTVVDAVNARLSGRLLVLTFEPDLTSFQPLILRMKKASVDKLILFALPEQALTYARQAAALKFSPETIGGDLFADQTFLRSARSMLKSLNFVYGKVSPEFIERYQKYSEDFSFFFEAASGYSLAEIV